jgi:hypothetical protein
MQPSVVQTELQYGTPRLNVVEHLFNEIYHQELQKTVHIPELDQREQNASLLE